MRLKKRGISTTMLLERRKLEDEFGSDMPTALMENLLERVSGRRERREPKAAEEVVVEAAGWDLDGSQGLISDDIEDDDDD